MRLPRSAAVALTAGAALAATVVGSGAGAAHGSPGRAADDPLYTFVAAPDFLNQDVADVRGRAGWHEGDPNSWTPQLQSSIDTFLDEVAAQQPQSVLVTGDLVEGHWFDDVAETGIFGPADSARDRAAMLKRAANFYQRVNLQRFTDRGLVLHAAVGDHDIGDNPWRKAFKRRNVPVLKHVFGKHYTRTPQGEERYANHPEGSEWDETAYAVKLSPDVLLVTLDVFHLGQDNVYAEVVGAQLRWLRDTLAKAQAEQTKWIIVQGHTPIATPVRTRSSSGMSVAQGTSSRLWKVMARYRVDLYLAGEVHNTTMRQADGITQISTGGLLYAGQATYLTAEVYADRIEFEVREFDHVAEGPTTDLLWQLGTYDTVGNRRLLPGSHSAGTLTLAADGSVTSATGKLAPYTD
ncbi:metallophosphoesterase family protein [Nocardioides sp.]|uniref:metallophosphoesterase family protein n=1 Tax=Nocardioides sp. TaxID=35761 RepID=UPI002ED7A905